MFTMTHQDVEEMIATAERGLEKIVKGEKPNDKERKYIGQLNYLKFLNL